jgi:hypothetical protein
MKSIKERVNNFEKLDPIAEAQMLALFFSLVVVKALENYPGL